MDSRLASSRHCQLSQTADGYVLEDLGSTNGTYVDGLRITSPTRVTPANQLTLGRTVPMPWPAEVVRYIQIGRVAGNDIVLNDSRVSSRHARLILVAGSETLIEDLGSSNGTFLNSPDHRVIGAVPLKKTDIVCFGTFTVPAARLMSSVVIPEPAAQTPRAASLPTPPVSGAATGANLCAANGRSRCGQPLVGCLAGQNLGTRGSSRFDFRPEHRLDDLRPGFTSDMARLFRGCLGIGGRTIAADGRGRRLDQAVACSIARGCWCSLHFAPWACALVLAIVYWWCGLRGPWLAMWGLMVMASSVALLFGLIVAAVSRAWITTSLVLLLSFLLMLALGGWLWPAPAPSLTIRFAMSAMPSRWAFEGLLLMERDAIPPMADDGTAPPELPIDLAEPYFPAATERMGTRADAMALGFMVVGLTVAAGFISLSSTRSP